ncbi:hypothetical protein [Tabrizicola sp.]|uniref:hypothetical protein n=1 Tax=Tabrizicola sp. TaxID=2005166 RepID=UPI003F381C59
MLDYDVTLIAGHREALLARTLASFATEVFPNFPIRRLIANIDPFMGDAAEGDRCEALVRSYFPDATIFRPETPEFASAVIRTWAATTAPRVLHLEDDWIALEPITAERVESLFRRKVSAVTFLNASKRTRGFRHQTVRRVTKEGDQVIEDISINAFSTSPGVFDGDFLREAARRMKPGLDPEKQFFDRTNPELEEHALERRCMFMKGQQSRMLIEDIGRAARQKAGLMKLYRDGTSVWRLSKHRLRMLERAKRDAS